MVDAIIESALSGKSSAASGTPIWAAILAATAFRAAVSAMMNARGSTFNGNTKTQQNLFILRVVLLLRHEMLQHTGNVDHDGTPLIVTRSQGHVKQ